MEKELKSQIEKGELTAGSNISYWTDSMEPKEYPSLNSDIKVDVVIVGAGNAGLSIAYQLIKSGKSVAVVEDGFIGSGETGRTSAHLTAALDSRYFELQKTYGEEKVKLIAFSHMQAIDSIEAISKTEKIECDFQRVSGFLFLDPSDIPETLFKEYKATMDAGLEVEFHERVPHIKNVNGPCLEFKNQAKFHPLKYLNGLASAITKRGGLIFTGTHAEEIDNKGIKTREGFRVNAKHIVVATNSPVNNKFLMHLRQYPYRSYVIGALVPRGSVEDALYWDTGIQDDDASIAAYHYVRIQSYNEKFDLLVCGGEDHPTGLADTTSPPEEKSKYKALIQWAKEHFQIGDVIYKWSGQVIYAFDDLGHVGRNPLDKDNIYIVTGDCGNGLTYGAIAGSLIPDLIDNKENIYEDIYSPSRFKFLQAGKVFIDEVVSGLVSYFKTKKSDEVDSLDDIPAGTGKTMEINGKSYGVSRGYDNYIDIVSAKCTHLGCTLKWNSDEESWDCPCHGSRFTNTGIVINGPANYNLDHYRIHEGEFDSLKHQKLAD